MMSAKEWNERYEVDVHTVEDIQRDALEAAADLVNEKSRLRKDVYQFAEEAECEIRALLPKERT